jgi:hypothetical protein
MKKLALLIAILTIFTSTAFAEIDVTVEGSSELTLGVNLDTSAVGFKNDNSSKISFKLADGTSEKGGESDVYGWIEIKEWAAEVNSSDGYKALDAGDVTAKIMFDGGWLKISGSNTETNITKPVYLNNNKDYKGVAVDVGGAGFVLGLDMAPAMIEVGISSPDDWADDDNSSAASYSIVLNTDNLDHVYGVLNSAAVADTDDGNDELTFGAHVKVTVDLAPLTVELAYVTDLNPNNAMGLGAKISADVAPLTVSVAGDVDLKTSDFEAVLDLSVALGEDMTLAVGGSYSSIDNIDVDVDFDAAMGDISVGLYALATDLDTDLRYIVEFDASMTTDTMKPYLTVGYGDISDADDDGQRSLEDTQTLKLNVGCEFYTIENVTLKADYAADPLGDSSGVITLSSKISY